MYPDCSPKEREYRIAKAKGAVFISQIGKVLSSGEKHDGRAPDYDDWELNGDIYRILSCSRYCLRTFLYGNSCRRDVFKTPINTCKLRRPCRTGFPKISVKRRTSLHCWRRYRAVPHMYVLFEKSTYRGSRIFYLAGTHFSKKAEEHNIQLL